MPARNSLEIDTLAATPKMTKPIDGGMHRRDDAGGGDQAGRARPCRGRRATIIGSSSAASAAASATAEPDSAAR